MSPQTTGQWVMRTAGLLFLFIFLNCGAALATCSGTCATDSDCAGKVCAYCNVDFGVCADCCEFVDAIDCPSACTWNGSECMNSAAVDCIGLPETPSHFRYYFYGALVIVLGGITWFSRKRLLPRKVAPKNGPKDQT